MRLSPGARTHRTDHKENALNTTAGITAARAINAHPWLSAVTPDPDDADTDLLISRAYNPGDEPLGHVEGRITWNPTSDGTVNYQVTLVYEGSGGTVEDEVTVEITPGPLAWLDLARPVAELMDRLDRELTAEAIHA